MNGFLAFFYKEIREILRTWRIWVLPGILLVVGLSSPVLAAITPWLLESVTADQPDVVVQMPDPDATDAYIQWAQQLVQIALLALVIAVAGIVSNERRNGTAVLVLTKPVSRAAFILAKFSAQTLLLIVGLIPATIVCWLMTRAIFDEAPVQVLIESTLLFLVLGILFIGVQTLTSTLVNSQAGAAGLGFVAYILISIFANWGPTRDFSPAGVLNAIGSVFGDDGAQALIPVATSLLATALILALAIAIFTRQEQAGRVGSG